MSASECEFNELIQAVRRANVVMDAAALAAEGRLRISRTDLVALELISVSSGLTVGEIAADIGISTGRATEVVDRLVARRLVSRHTDAADRRRTVVTITPSGRTRFRTAFRERWAWVHQIASEVSADDLHCIVYFLERLHEIMPEAWRPTVRASVPEITLPAAREAGVPAT